jgi:hypothetical protein
VVHADLSQAEPHATAARARVWHAPIQGEPMDACLTAGGAPHAAYVGRGALSPSRDPSRTAGSGRITHARGRLPRRGGGRCPPHRGPPCCHDGTERPIPRPQDATEQKAYDRGKNKRHTWKNLLLIHRAVRMLFLSETHPGHVHDQRLADTTPYPLPAGSQLLQDLGLQALTLDGVDIVQPTKKPRGPELTRAQKAGNRKIARRRVRIEHVTSRVKRCRMLKETIRLWKAGLRDMVMEIGGALHNFRVRLTPSWTPMIEIVMNSNIGISCMTGLDITGFSAKGIKKPLIHQARDLW